MLKIKKNNFTKKNISQKINVKTGLPISYSSEITDNFISEVDKKISEKEQEIIKV